MLRRMLRLLFLLLWFLCIAVLAGWLAAAVHRRHLAAICIVGFGLVALVVVPMLAARLNRTEP
jgi:biotin transporter BioY